MKHATLAVGITYHDEGRLLTECLESLGAQGRLPDEILVYDDASKLSPAREFIPSNVPVRLIRSEENRRPGFGRNVLLKEANSQYIHFHDADDLFRKGWVERVSEALEGDADIVWTEVACEEAGKVLEDAAGLRALVDDPDLVTICIKGGPVIRPVATTVRRSKAIEIGGYKTWETLPLVEDFDFHLRFLAAGARYAIVPESLVVARSRPDSHSIKNYAACLASKVVAVNDLAGILPEKYLADLSEASWRSGAKLFLMGKKREAARGFAVAKRLGNPQYGGRPWTYKLVARTFGPMLAESSGYFYRRIFPSSFRKAFRLDKTA